MRTMNPYWVFGLGLFLLAKAVPAQNCDPSLSLAADCTLARIKESIRIKAFPLDEMQEEIQEEVVNANRATTSPDSFASQLHASYQDFLNLLSFAVNKVEESEDGQALVVRFNPLRKQPLLIGSSLTLTKPSVADSVSQAIPEEVRSATLEKLNAQQDGLADQTWSISLSPTTGSNKCSWNSTSRCWGRTPSTYHQMLSLTLKEVVKSTSFENQGAAALRPLVLLGCNNLQCKASDLSSPENWNKAVEITKEMALAEIEQARANQDLFKKSGFEKMAMLIDNQPQLSITGSYRNVDRYSGPDEFAASVELQFGLQNLNDLKGTCDADNCAQKIRNLQTEGLDSTKIVLTASYRERRPFSLLDLGLDAPVDGFMPIDRGKSSELKARLQGGLNLSADVAGRNTRLDVAIDGIRTNGDLPKEEKQNRWVGTATLTIPLGDKVSVPVSLTYANRPEFLGEQKQQFGMHFGLSWRLPFGPAAGSVAAQ